MQLPLQMNAMVLERTGQPLSYKKMPVPMPSEDQVLIKVMACGVCRTDLHIVDGELQDPKLPLIPGHQVIGTVIQSGKLVKRYKPGNIIGITWLAYTCGQCEYCLQGNENLCEIAEFTGYTRDGGYAEYMVADAEFCFPLPEKLHNSSRASLLCAGIIGYRCYRMIPETARSIGFYGFGAAAHILIQVARRASKEIYAFTREGDKTTQKFAMDLGAVWAGSSAISAPVKLDAAIIFASAGELVPQALKNLNKGGMLVCGGIHMTDIPKFPYQILWQERTIKSVANLTRKDAELFLKAASEMDIDTKSSFYLLSEANLALDRLREGKLTGAAVLVI